MGLLRTALAALVITAAFFALRDTSYAWFQCNRAEKQAESATEWAEEHAESFRGVSAARRALERMRSCIDRCPASIDPYMVAAADYFVLNQLPQTIAMYEAALHYDRRPEIYFELGMAYLQAGQRERATSTLFVWNLFFGQHTEVIPDPDVKAAVEAATARFFAQGAHAQMPAPLRSDL